MYIVVHSKKFKKSLKKIEKSGRYSVQEIRSVVYKIASGDRLDEKYEDHQLHGKMSIYRECHMKSDLLLIYELNKKELILLTIDIGSHSELFK